MEHKIGEVFRYSGVNILTHLYRPSDGLIHPCQICVFGILASGYPIPPKKFMGHCTQSKDFRGQCLSTKREDGNRVIFFTKREYSHFRRFYNNYVTRFS